MNDYASLIDRLTLTSPSAPQGSIRESVNNPYFRDIEEGVWNAHIIDTLRNRHDRLPTRWFRRKENIDYKNNGDISLLEKGIEHVNAHFRPLTSKNVVIINHGLYPFITHSHVVHDGHEDEMSTYKNNLVKLLNSKDLLDANFVVNETLHHYIDSTSMLVEDGVVDGAFLTKYDTGTPLTNDDLEMLGCKNRIKNEFYHALRDKNVIFVGGYNASAEGVGCLGTAMCKVLDVVGMDNIYAIRGLVLNYPLAPKSSMLAQIAWYDYEESVPEEQTLTFDETLKMFGK
jgi:hypothetical protein